MDVIFFFNDTATTEISSLPLHDALPIYRRFRWGRAAELFFLDERSFRSAKASGACINPATGAPDLAPTAPQAKRDRKSTRLNSSHANISYAVFCLKKKKNSCSEITTLFF